MTQYYIMIMYVQNAVTDMLHHKCDALITLLGMFRKP